MIRLFGVDVHVYGLLIGLAIIAAWEVANKIASKKNFPAGYIDEVVYWVVPGGIIGARIYHVIDYWQRYYSSDVLKIFYIWEGGLGIWGAIAGGVLALLIYLIKDRILNKNNRVTLLDTLDCVSVGVPLAQAIGRLGNWVNGELYGKNNEPLFAFEAVLNLILFTLLWSNSKTANKPGLIFGNYLIGYGLIRVLLEGLRPDEIIWRIYTVPVAILFGIFSILLGLFLVFVYKTPPKSKYSTGE